MRVELSPSYRADLDDVRGHVRIVEIDQATRTLLVHGDRAAAGLDRSADGNFGAGGDEFDAPAGARRGGVQERQELGGVGDFDPVIVRYQRRAPTGVPVE